MRIDSSSDLLDHRHRYLMCDYPVTNPNSWLEGVIIINVDQSTPAATSTATHEHRHVPMLYARG